MLYTFIAVVISKRAACKHKMAKPFLHTLRHLFELIINEYWTPKKKNKNKIIRVHPMQGSETTKTQGVWKS